MAVATIIDQVGSGVKRFQVGVRGLGMCAMQYGECPKCNRGPSVYCHHHGSVMAGMCMEPRLSTVP